MLRRGWVVLAVVLAWATHAAAQPASDEFGIERFRLATDRAGLLDVDWAGVSGHGSWSAGVFLGFAHDPLVIYDKTMAPIDALVDRRLTTGLVGSYALWNRVELGLGLDIIGYQSGSESSPTMKSLPGGGLGDARLSAKVLLLSSRSLQLAVIPAFSVPAGSAGGYLREAGVTFSPALAISGSRDRIRAAANVGYRLKPRVDVAGLQSDDEAFARIAAGIRLGSVRAPVAELWWSTSVSGPLVDSSANQIALEMLAGGTRRVSSLVGVFVAGGVGLDNGFGVPDWRALVGMRVESTGGDRDGDHVEGNADRCPDDPEDDDGFEDDDGCPELDNDGDGLADGADRCPNEHEDKDGYQDEDGCIDLDNDGDGVADAQDRCPGQAEDKDGFADEDGCPDPKQKLTGRIVDAAGRPIPGAAMTILAPGGATIEVTVGDDGRFTAEVDGNAVKVTARAAEYKEATTDLTVTAADIAVPLVRAVRQGQLRGQVLSFDGKPVAATIKVTGKAATSTTTDAAGQFTLELPQGSFEVTIEAPGHVTQKRKVTVKLDGVTVLNVDLRGKK